MAEGPRITVLIVIIDLSSLGALSRFGNFFLEIFPSLLNSLVGCI